MISGMRCSLDIIVSKSTVKVSERLQVAHGKHTLLRGLLCEYHTTTLVVGDRVIRGSCHETYPPDGSEMDEWRTSTCGCEQHVL